MLTESGLNEALKLCDIPVSKKELLPTKSYEVEKLVKRLAESSQPENYDPIDRDKKASRTVREYALRDRAFRQAVVGAYGYSCAVCGLKIKSPDSLLWEVEAAHIVPHRSRGRDDICNGIALCHLHHWAFDVGWITVADDYKIQVSPQIQRVPTGWGRLESYELFRVIRGGTVGLRLPKKEAVYPHQNAIRWHRQNIFYEQCA